jgi:hypothetical protein
MADKEKLSKKEKLAIVRDIIIKMPNYRKYGFNRAVINIFKKNHGITISDRDISEYIKDVEKQWQEADDIKTSKAQLKEMLMNVYETHKIFPHAQIRSLREIGKLDGHYSPEIAISNINIDKENIEKLEDIFGKRENKVINDSKKE